jgi:hypothetical protein
MIKIEICTINQDKAGQRPRVHGDFLFWQMKHKNVKCSLSHDKMYVFFEEESEFEKFKSTWNKPFRRLY